MNDFPDRIEDGMQELWLEPRRFLLLYRRAVDFRSPELRLRLQQFHAAPEDERDPPHRAGVDEVLHSPHSIWIKCAGGERADEQSGLGGLRQRLRTEADYVAPVYRNAAGFMFCPLPYFLFIQARSLEFVTSIAKRYGLRQLVLDPRAGIQMATDVRGYLLEPDAGTAYHIKDQLLQHERNHIEFVAFNTLLMTKSRSGAQPPRPFLPLPFETM